MRPVNLFGCELDESSARGTIAARGAMLRPKLGAQKIARPCTRSTRAGGSGPTTTTTASKSGCT